MSVGMQVGAYRIIQQIGEGGMGTVWIAEHMTIGRKAAVKMLHGEYTDRREIVQRFFNEARAATQISDPGIVQIFDFGTTPEGRAYIVMELLEGEPLDRRIQRNGRLTVKDSLRILRQVSSTLGAAHARGIIHRDLKPENVFMCPDPEVPSGERAKILDFGIAKLSDNAGVKTQTNAIMGTPQYMSPEQCRGSGGIDARSDVYAIGCMFFGLITGLPPFVADGHGELIVMHLTQPAPLLSTRAPHVPASVDALVARCLAKQPGDRFATGKELAEAIGMLITSTSSHPAASASMPVHQQATIALGVPSPTVPAPTPTTLSGTAAQQTGGTLPPARKGRGALLAVGALALVAVAGGGVFLAMNKDKSSETTAATTPEPTQPTTPEPATPEPPKAEPPKPEPPKPEPPKPEPTQPAAATKVAITIESTPDEAQVFVGNEKTARGKTPYVLELEKGSPAVEVKLVRRGYVSKKSTVTPTEDTKLALTLDKVKVVSGGSTGDSDDTMNPFANKKK